MIRDFPTKASFDVNLSSMAPKIFKHFSSEIKSFKLSMKWLAAYWIKLKFIEILLTRKLSWTSLSNIESLNIKTFLEQEHCCENINALECCSINIVRYDLCENHEASQSFASFQQRWSRRKVVRKTIKKIKTYLKD